MLLLVMTTSSRQVHCLCAGGTHYGTTARHARQPASLLLEWQVHLAACRTSTQRHLHRCLEACQALLLVVQHQQLLPVAGLLLVVQHQQLLPVAGLLLVDVVLVWTSGASLRRRLDLGMSTQGQLEPATVQPQAAAAYSCCSAEHNRDMPSLQLLQCVRSTFTCRSTVRDIWDWGRGRGRAGASMGTVGVEAEVGGQADAS